MKDGIPLQISCTPYIQSYILYSTSNWEYQAISGRSYHDMRCDKPTIPPYLIPGYIILYHTVYHHILYQNISNSDPTRADQISFDLPHRKQSAYNIGSTWSVGLFENYIHTEVPRILYNKVSIPGGGVGQYPKNYNFSLIWPKGPYDLLLSLKTGLYAY